MLQWCYSGVTVVLQECYRSVTEVLRLYITQGRITTLQRVSQTSESQVETARRKELLCLIDYTLCLVELTRYPPMGGSGSVNGGQRLISFTTTLVVNWKKERH